MKKEELLNKINSIIELLGKHERFNELEYKVRRLKSELASGKYIYPEKTIKASIEERGNEMREIKERYIKPANLDGERVKLLKWLQEL